MKIMKVKDPTMLVHEYSALMDAAASAMMSNATMACAMRIKRTKAA
jgi:hypothetical protein